MLSKEQNQQLTQVGPGTPMGNVLRNYWYPIAFTADFEEFPVKKVRLLGEDFALYKMASGDYGIVQEACPHRSASLVYGIVEADGIRCGYHGWCFDTEGNCVDQPAEPAKSTFKGKITAFAGSAQELGGMVWAYIGEQPAPELPKFDVFVMDGIKDVGHAMLPCNWLQIMENSVDPHHVEYLHGRYFEFLGNKQGFEAPKAFQKKHQKVGFDVFDYGIIKRRVLEGQTEANDDWAVGHPLVFPHSMRVGGGGIDQMQIRVPIDDTHTWAMFYSNHSSPHVTTYPEQPLSAYEYEWMDDAGNHIVDYIEGQDVMAWVSQGEIVDRSAEHIGKSDIGIVMLRRMFKEALAAVEAGEDPIGVVRTPHERIDLPCEKDKFGAGADFPLAWIDMGSMKYSPIKSQLEEFHVQANNKASA